MTAARAEMTVSEDEASVKVFQATEATSVPLTRGRGVLQSNIVGENLRQGSWNTFPYSRAINNNTTHGLEGILSDEIKRVVEDRDCSQE